MVPYTLGNGLVGYFLSGPLPRWIATAEEHIVIIHEYCYLSDLDNDVIRGAE